MDFYVTMILRILVLMFLFVAVKVSACPLEGYWKSNEEKTLASFRQAKNSTEKQKALLSEDFFGKLYIQFECEKFTAVLEDWVETYSYALVSATDKNVTFKYSSELEGEVVREATIEGDCYSLSINDGQFKEYFCPITPKAFSEAIELARYAATRLN
ncbi:hypothetical protein ACUR5C_00570 [Aliikangiella sp. IMCC44653]